MPTPKKPGAGPIFGDRRKKRRHPSHVLSSKSFLAACMGDGRTRYQLVEFTGMAQETISRYILTYRMGTLSLIHISAYRKRGPSGAWAPVYKFGINQPDLSEPLRRSRKEAKAGFINWKIINTPEGKMYEYVPLYYPN